MKKDITFPVVEGIEIAIVRKLNELNSYEWYVYLLNRNKFALENLFITSHGFGELKAEVQQKTSVLRHFFKEVAAESNVLVEPIDESVFHLHNEYWVSYFADNQLFDKRFVFVPDSLVAAPLRQIAGLEMEGILHN